MRQRGRSGDAASGRAILAGPLMVRRGCFSVEDVFGNEFRLSDHICFNLVDISEALKWRPGPDGFWFSGLGKAPIFPQARSPLQCPCLRFLFTSLYMFLT